MLADCLRYNYANDDPDVKSRLLMTFDLFYTDFCYVYMDANWPSIITKDAVFKDNTWPF